MDESSRSRRFKRENKAEFKYSFGEKSRTRRREKKPPPELKPEQKQTLSKIAIVFLLAWYFGSAVTAVADKSTTFDELFHLTAGYSYWTLGDFRMQPENGNLPQRWAAIPLLLSRTNFPSLDQDAWRLSSMGMIGDQFFYNSQNDADRMLWKGRAMIALFGVALGALVFFWTRSLFGEAAAFVSLTLYAFCPTVLNNGALVTSDMCAALFFAASLACVWRVIHHLSWKTLLTSSLVMGGLFVAKFSAAMLVPMGLLLMIAQLISRQPLVVVWKEREWQVTSRLVRFGLQTATIAVHVVVVWIVIWTFYSFRYDMFAKTTPKIDASGNAVVMDQPSVPWNIVLKPARTVDGMIAKMRDAHFLPEAYLYGFAHSWSFAQQRSAFLNGKYSIKGWPQFFPYCLMVKTPLTLFALMGLGFLAIAKGWYSAGATWMARLRAMLASIYRATPLLSLFVVYWAFAIPSHLNIGHRHILPTYPVMLILAGASVAWLEKRVRLPEDAKTPREKTVAPEPSAKIPAVAATEKKKRRRIRRFPWPTSLAKRRWPLATCMVSLCIALFVMESASQWPNYLAYFNQIIGNQSNAYKHLVDSSLDWGQELPALKHWLVKEGLDGSLTEKTYLSYFGTANPTYYGIKAHLLPCYAERKEPGIPESLEAGTYCISATMVQSVYNVMLPGPWSRQYEAIYQQLLAQMRAFDEAKTPEAKRRLINQTGEAFWFRAFRQYEFARFGRLTSYLRQRKPDTEINNAILIYRLDKSELIRALDGPPVELEDSPPATPANE